MLLQFCDNLGDCPIPIGIKQRVESDLRQCVDHAAILKQYFFVKILPDFKQEYSSTAGAVHCKREK